MMKTGTMIVAASLALSACAVDDGASEATKESSTSTLRIPLVDGLSMVDCANVDGGRATRLMAVTDDGAERWIPYSGCDGGTVLVGRPGRGWSHLRIEVVTDGATWDACPGLVELADSEDTYAFDVGTACDP